MKGLVIGGNAEGGNDTSFYRAFKDLLQDDIYFLNQYTLLKNQLIFNKAYKKITGNSNPYSVFVLNEAILQAAKKIKPDFIFAFKGNCITAKTIQQLKTILPNIIITHFHPDSLFNSKNCEKYFYKSIPYYNIHFVPKLNNIPLYHDKGNRNTVYLPYAADTGWHYPAKASANEQNEYAAEVSFIGAFETERANAILAISNHIKSKIKVWGHMWESFNPGTHPNLEIKRRMLLTHDMSKAINYSKINLAFLRKANNDEITARTFEIPGSGGFMLHERTEEAMSFFAEGKEAEYFSSNEECADKIKFYLKNESIRQKIALASYNKVLTHGYTYHDRAKHVIDIINQKRNSL